MATVDTNLEQRAEDRNWKRPRKTKHHTKLSDWKSIEDDREKYAAYLCSREWSVLKEHVKNRSLGKCERCRIFDGDAVHHLTYERKYNERLEDLQHTCKHCHSFIHGKSKYDPCDADIALVRMLMCCKTSGQRPIPFEILTGLADTTALTTTIEEVIRAARILNAAGLENPARTLGQSLPFYAPYWFFTGEHGVGPSTAFVSFKLCDMDTGFGDLSWWRDDEA